MKSKKLVIALLLVLAFVFTTGTFAYWASSVEDSTNNATGTVTIGTGGEVQTSVNVSAQLEETDTLVPVGFATGTNEVDNLDFVFPVEWVAEDGADGDGVEGTLAVSTESVLVDGNDKSGLFTVTITGDGSITEGTPQNVTVNVEFTNEPADQTEYNEVATYDLVITLSFLVTAD